MYLNDRFGMKPYDTYIRSYGSPRGEYALYNDRDTNREFTQRTPRKGFGPHQDRDVNYESGFNFRTQNNNLFRGTRYYDNHPQDYQQEVNQGPENDNVKSKLLALLQSL